MIPSSYSPPMAPLVPMDISRNMCQSLRMPNFLRISTMSDISRSSGIPIHNTPSSFYRIPVVFVLKCVGHLLSHRNLHVADFVTMLNGFCGIMSIFNSLAFCLSHPSDYTYLWKALGFLPMGLLADFFDGKVARWRGKSSLLGQELDSLADLVHFTLKPLIG